MGFAVATVLFDAIGIALIFPIMPALLADIGIENISNAVLYGGALATGYALMQFIFMPVLGNLSDRFGRRPVLLAAIAALFVDYIIMGMAQSFAVLFIGRLIAGVAGATVSTATAYIADVSAPEDRGKNFGMVGAAFGAGFILGPAIGGMVGEYGVRLPFFLAAGFAGVNFLFGWFLLPESLALENRRPFRWRRANPINAIGRAVAAKRLRPTLIVVFCLMVAGYVYPSVWAFYGKEMFDWSLSTTGFTLAVFGLGTVFVQAYLIRRMLPALGENRTIRLGISVAVIGLLAIVFAFETWMIFALIPVVVLGEVAGPALNGFLSRQVPDSEQGDLQGVLGSIESLAAVFAPPMFALLFKLFTTEGWPYFPAAPFFAAALIVAFGLMVFMRQK